jgi:hypothetical protein
MIANFAAAFALVFDPYVLWVIFASALFGFSWARCRASRRPWRRRSSCP